MYVVFKLHLFEVFQIQVTTCQEVYAYLWCKMYYFFIQFYNVILIV